jgi:hypothetical protein
MSHIFAWASVAFGLLAAVLWSVASIIRARYRPRINSATGLTDFSIAANGVDLLRTAQVQTMWNMWAALSTRVSVALQALSLASSN